MRTWVVTFIDKEFKRDMAVVVAPTYTMALVEFMVEHPDCNYTGVFEVMRSESAFT